MSLEKRAEKFFQERLDPLCKTREWLVFDDAKLAAEFAADFARAETSDLLEALGRVEHERAQAITEAHRQGWEAAIEAAFDYIANTNRLNMSSHEAAELIRSLTYPGDKP